MIRHGEHDWKIGRKSEVDPPTRHRVLGNLLADANGSSGLYAFASEIPFHLGSNQGTQTGMRSARNYRPLHLETALRRAMTTPGMGHASHQRHKTGAEANHRYYPARGNGLDFHRDSPRIVAARDYSANQVMADIIFHLVQQRSIFNAINDHHIARFPHRQDHRTTRPATALRQQERRDFA
ncbi:MULTISPECIES: hypothetical protein [Burkholderia]|uniref:hypothetical protein n=1 Tax=Burkholderia TaxID=32008 RepID=UPI0011149393|nr:MULTISPECIES: hypothetical protein [Burkholderia]